MSVSLLRRIVLTTLVSTALTTCSVSDGLVPPASVDTGTKVSSISPPRQSAMRMAPMETAQSYPASAPVSRAGGSVDYLDTPNLAGEGHAAGDAAPASGRRLPMIDSDEALAQQRVPRSQNAAGNWGGTQQLSVPDGGVNMDSELGAEPVVGLAQEQQQQIAEGETAEPVVDGIGTDAPTQRNAMPRPAAQAQMSQARVVQRRRISIFVAGSACRKT